MDISGNFWEAFLNVLGIVGIIVLAIGIVVGISWLILSSMGNKNHLFDKNQINNNNATNITNNYGDNYRKQEAVEPKEEFVKVEEPVQQRERFDFEKARLEELELAQKQQKSLFEDVQPVQEEPEAIFAKEETIDYDSMINEINDNALKAYNNLQSEEIAKKVLNIQPQEEVKPTKASEEEYEEPMFDDALLDEFESFENELEEETFEEVNEEKEEKVVAPVVVDKDAQNEILKRLEEQINELKQQLEEQRKENEELRKIAEEEKAKLNAIIAKRNDDDDDEGKKMKDYVGNLDELEARLEVLKERLKANEKELRINKKEFIPLSKVKKTLESDKKKLRRREAIVAKRKVLLYGVNNYADIDEEKAKELNEELDLLEGLRLSVAHCEEVMETNKERYPILEHTNKILTENNAQIKEDIAKVEEEIEQARKKKEEN